MSSRSFKLIVAAAECGGIGLSNSLPWKIAGDMKFFKDVTSKVLDSSRQNAVVMGRKTWESIPTKFRPLNDRLNVVLSRNENIKSETDIPEKVLTFTSLQKAVSSLSQMKNIESIWVIGGSSIYEEALKMPECGQLFITRVFGDFECDKFFPKFSRKTFALETVSPLQVDKSGIKYQFMTYNNTNISISDNPVSLKADLIVPQHEEMQYLNIVQKIIDEGVIRKDRTGTGTKALFGVSMRYSLRDNILPLLTTKRVFWRGVAEELLWFVAGETNAQKLQDKNIHIWDGNASREYLDSIGLKDREAGDLGPVYGFQWRHFGAPYSTMHADYTGQGYDQLAAAIERIKTKPNDRRIIVSAWNPADLHLMALPPCHMFCQFFVANGELSCQMYQRSADMGLGVPFNIASYSLLTILMAQCTGLKPGEFVHVIGDAHVYLNHIEPLREQLKRKPRPFPTLHVNSDCTDIDGFKYEDFEVKGYKPHKTIKMEMSV